VRPPNSIFSDLLVAGVEDARQAQAAQKPNKIAAATPHERLYSLAHGLSVTRPHTAKQPAESAA
jgi:hypothetical protein